MKGITTQKQRSEISNLWYYSKTKQSKPNLVLKCDFYRDKATLFYYGTYFFNPITGTNHIFDISDKMQYKDIKAFLILN